MTDSVNLSIYKSLVGAAIDRADFFNLFSAPVGAPASFQFKILQKSVTIVNLRRPSRSSILTSSLFAAGVPTVNFYSAFVGAMSLCEIPNLCQFP